MIIRKNKISEDEWSIVAQINMWLVTVGTASRYGHFKCKPLYYPITLDKVHVFMLFLCRCAAGCGCRPSLSSLRGACLDTAARWRPPEGGGVEGTKLPTLTENTLWNIMGETQCQSAPDQGKWTIFHNVITYKQIATTCIFIFNLLLELLMLL